ncbi:hypothetical protein JL101_029340 (plasmid) [Skermanella rosea]|uniref:hypothetical protein n=1 Tax=Skermanella rosea TaxID=1817965 RepID=UPI0019328FB1|nr:hypothetical protein [Skermanella rosea]UEM07107.1 hypothetical protein JL101_029340 [Skermanella rosea]
MAKRFSASTIKSWFQYRCERKARYELLSDGELAAVPIVKDTREDSWALLGKDFERRVIDRLHREQGVLKPSAGEDVLDQQQTAAFLRGRVERVYAHQVNLRPSGEVDFLKGTGLELARNMADLVRREAPSRPGGKRIFTLIDIKATRRATPFHKTQVAFYARVLEALLKEMAVTAPLTTEISPYGEIWHIPEHGSADGDAWEVDQFALAPYLRLVDDFCQNQLPVIARKRVGHGIDETFFHLYFKCEQCKFLEHCEASVSAVRQPLDRDVSAVPGLSHEGKRALLHLGVRTVGDLAKATGLAKAPGVGWSLSRRAPLLVARAKSLSETRVLRTEEQQTFLMPPQCDVCLLVSVDHDPVDGRIAAIGYRRIEGGAVSNEVIRVPQTGSLRHESDALVTVLSALIMDLNAIDHANAARPAGDDGLHAHIFFYEPAEAVNLQRAIGRHLNDTRIRSGLLHLVRLFPPDEVVPEPEFRGVHHLPATAVRSVVEHLWALPLSVAYDLRQVSDVLCAEGPGHPYRPAPKFARRFSSLLPIEVIRKLREARPDAASIDDIRADVSARLDALQGVINWIMTEHRRQAAAGSPLLRLAKKPFRFQASFDPLNAVDLDVLLACELLENRAGLLEALVNLAQPAQRRRDAGRCLAGLTLKKEWPYGPYRIMQFHVPEESRDSDLGPGDIDLILTDDTPDLRLDPAQWKSLACQLRPPDEAFRDRRDLLQVQVWGRVFEGPAFQTLLRRVGKEPGWYIDRGFNDVNTAKAAAFLSNLARSDRE